MGPERVMDHPAPAQNMLSESTQLLAIAVEIVALLAALPVAIVVSVKTDDPLGLLILTTEFAGNALNRAAAKPAVVELPL